MKRKETKLPDSLDALIADAKRRAKNGELIRRAASARKNRVRKTGVQQVKEKINGERYKVLQGTLVNDHIRVFARTETCHVCREESNVVTRITVVQRDRENNHYMTSENDINSHAMLAFQEKDLPIQFTTRDKIIPACYACLVTRSLERSKREPNN